MGLAPGAPDLLEVSDLQALPVAATVHPVDPDGKAANGLSGARWHPDRGDPVVAGVMDPRARHLEPYDRGYRDGWHDIHVSPQGRRRRQPARCAEYALRYEHSRSDGPTWGQYPEWREFASAPRIADAPEPLVWTRRDGASHAALLAFASPGFARGAGVVSGATPRPSKALREAVA